MRKVKPRLYVLVVLAALVLATSLTANGQTKPDPGKPSNPAENATPPNPAKPIEGIPAAVDPNKYLIGAEDVLFIRTWHEPDFTIPVAVRPDGKITIPLIGDVQAADLTPQQLTKSIIEQLTKYINNPDVNVFVTEVRSKKYYIDGEVGHPSFFPLVTPTTVLEALSHAGGFKEFANTKKIRILRGNQILHFNFNEVSKGKHLEQNIYVQNGDHIIVP